ncbi:hypothetical protein KJF94_28625 [Pseudomonas hormoni]|uniref:Type II secretion system protein GspC N-terminal domain-containing protein n=1 Tax=Pseudomonas hormoni TaxID=3093767 RepID=A0ABX8F805_9PSED|nr:hypothetical protein KJF94_28625 [Pseudomonas hormoni]
MAVGYAAFLAWQEWGFRKSLASPLSFAATVPTPPPRAPLDTTAVATVLGLATETTLLPSAEPLTLQASFVLGTGLSRALLADAQGSRVYQVGDQLPGGSVLRRVEANQAVLWNKGREEVLMLQTAAARFLRQLDSPSHPQTPVSSTRFLRPLSGQPE